MVSLYCFQSPTARDGLSLPYFSQILNGHVFIRSCAEQAIGGGCPTSDADRPCPFGSLVTQNERQMHSICLHFQILCEHLFLPAVSL